MSMYSIIINPTSGGGAALKKLSAIEELLRSRGIEYRIDSTSAKGDAGRLAEKAANDRLQGVIAVGGDGTFSEVVNGIKESGIELIFAPSGTGNDFMRMFKLPRDTVTAVRKQLDSPVRMIDLGKCNDRYFLNVTGCGFDVEVLLVADKYKGKASALSAYLRGAYSAIKNYRPMDISVALDDSDEIRMESTVVSVGNGSFIGGGMKAVPGAKVDDGYFDVLLVNKVNRLSIYVLLLLFAAGKHTILKKLVTMVKCKKVRIRSTGMHLEADGEVFAADDVTMSVVPGALSTRLPI